MDIKYGMYRKEKHKDISKEEEDHTNDDSNREDIFNQNEL